jgi:hypothetical protein
MTLRIPGTLSPRILLLATFLGVSPSAGAECVKVPPKQLLELPGTELAFSGKVIEVTNVSEQGVRATFDVDRVWAGRVPKRFDMYMTYPASAEAPRYDKDQSYVVIARRLVDKQARGAAGFADSDIVLFTGVTCSDFYSIQEFVRALGPGGPPAEKLEQDIDRRK